MPKFNGTLMALYVSLTAPGNPQSIAGYSRVGYTKDLKLPRSRAEIDTSDKDTGLDSGVVGGRRSANMSATINLLDDNSDAGQQKIEQAYASERGEIWFLATQNVAGRKQYWGKAVVTQCDLDFPEEQLARMAFGAKVDGVLSSGIQA